MAQIRSTSQTQRAFLPTVDWMTRGGYRWAIIWVPDTGEHIVTPAVRRDPQFVHQVTRRETGRGYLEDQTRLRGIDLEVLGELQQNTLRQWFEGGAKINLTLLALGRGRSYQFLEPIPCIVEPVDAPRGRFQSDRLVLRTVKFRDAKVHVNSSLIGHVDFKDWLINGGDTDPVFLPATQHWLVSSDAGEPGRIFFDLILPADSRTLYQQFVTSDHVATATRTVRAQPLQFSEIGSAYDAPAAAYQDTVVLAEGRTQNIITMPSVVYGVRLLFDQVSTVLATTQVKLPGLYASSRVAQMVGTPLATYGITGTDLGGAGTRLTIDDIISQVVAGSEANTHVLTVPDESVISVREDADGLLTVLYTDNDWDQP